MAGEAFLLGEQQHVVGDRFAGPARVKWIMLLDRRKSLRDRPLANRAVAPVGSTCDGPAA